MTLRTLTIAAALAAAPATGQILVADNSSRFAWTESAGYLNLAPISSDEAAGVEIFTTYMQGYGWSESFGWVNFGNGPTDGMSYLNFSNIDFGVNVLPGGILTGYAWIEGGGWINFDTSSNEDVPDARIDFDTLRLRGWAWGEGIGWINFDDDEVFVVLTPTCPADTNFDGVVTPADYNAWILAFNNQTAICDQNNDGACTPADYNGWILNFNAGC